MISAVVSASGRCVLEFRLRHDLVDVIHQLHKARRLAVPRMLQPDIEIRTNACRISPQHHHPVGEHHGLFDVVRHNENGAGRHLLVQPELQQFTAQVFRGKNVERRKRFVHEQHFRFDDQSARESHALLHASGKFLGIRGLKAIQANRVEHAQSAFVALDGRHSLGFQRSFNILQHGEPGEQSEALKNDGHVGHLAVKRLAVPQQGSRRRLRKSGQHAQQRGLAAARGPQQGNDLPRFDREIGQPDDLNPRSVGLRIRLLNPYGFDDRFSCRLQSAVRIVRLVIASLTPILPTFYTRTATKRKARFL